MKKKPSLENFLEIDQFNLDRELAIQPKLFGKYADRLATAEDSLTRLEDRLEFLKSELGHRIRRKPSKYGLLKVTDPSVKEAYIRHPEYQEALKNIADAKRIVGGLKGVVRALEHRKRVLEKLVDLRLADYFSEPRPSKPAVKALNSHTVRKGIVRENRESDDDDDAS